MSSYQFVVPNDTYNVVLRFSEIDPAITRPNQRVFTATVEGATTPPIDIFAEAGGARMPLLMSQEVAVADGVLNIDFTPAIGLPLISGIELYPVTQDPVLTSYSGTSLSGDGAEYNVGLFDVSVSGTSENQLKKIRSITIKQGYRAKICRASKVATSPSICRTWNAGIHKSLGRFNGRIITMKIQRLANLF
jgi:hypothetical protein